MDFIICFIDDSDFEHDLVENEIAPCAPGLEFVQAYTFGEARERLGTRIPVLFLLDLWGQDTEVETPRIMPKEELQRMVLGIDNLDRVYEGLEDFPGDKYNEYLKRLFRIVDSWRNLFEEVCGHIGQNRKYGLGNLRQVKECYPGVPAVFYTRKSLINDAVEVFREGTDGLMIKPTGRDDADTRLLTRGYAPQLIEALAQVIDSKADQLREKSSHYRNMAPGREGDVESLISGWKEFRNKSRSESRSS